MSSFIQQSAVHGHPAWENLVRRKTALYDVPGECRSPFMRDYTRILHSLAYRRLKHKTQVFPNVNNDHSCTRIEHVAHVDSVSSTIAAVLGLNTELTHAIAIGHDLGHAPFGHHGEMVLGDLCREHLGTGFWHEKNGLRFVDHIELLPDKTGAECNLSLTYAVRDGIISHCGELNQNNLKPREEYIDLERDFEKAGQYQPFTWEGCVVKVSDKIAYLGRDIEDAITQHFLSDEDKDELREMARIKGKAVLNTTSIIGTLIGDICENSSPEAGITLSDEGFKLINSLKAFNYRTIYHNRLFNPYLKYSRLAMEEIFSTLDELVKDGVDWGRLDAMAKHYRKLVPEFMSFLLKYADPAVIPEKLRRPGYVNEKLYGDLTDPKARVQAIIDFIAGMTDRFAIKVFNDLLLF